MFNYKATALKCLVQGHFPRKIQQIRWGLNLGQVAHCTTEPCRIPDSNFFYLPNFEKLFQMIVFLLQKVENIVENGGKTASSFSCDVFRRLLSHGHQTMETTCTRIHVVVCVPKARLD